MTEMEQLTDVIALSIHAETEPLLRKIAILEARPVSYGTKEAWDALQETLSDLRSRLVSVEARAPVPGPVGPAGEMGPKGLDGVNGKDGAAGLHGKDGRDGLDGKDGAAGLHGKDGRDGLDGKHGANGLDGKDGAAGLDGKDGANGLQGKDGRDGIDGKDGAAGLHGKDGRDGIDGKDGVSGLAGKSVTLADVAPVIAASVTNAFEAMPKPKDGLGVKSAVITNDGRLLLTWSDETVKDLGVVMGKAGRDGLPAIGRPGTDGTSVTLADVRPMIQTELTKAVAAIPKTKDGIDGKDGLGFDDFDLAFDELKGWFMVFSRGSERKSFHVPIPWDAGVWQVGRLYPKGAGTTVKGAFFIAQVATKTRPDDGTPESARAWRLAVKGGRDGKPGKDGRDGTDV